MQAVGCPKCGAPLQGVPNGPFYQCPYCKHTSTSQAPVAPQFVIIQQPSYAPPPQQLYVHAPTRRSGSPILASLFSLAVFVIIMGIVFHAPLVNLTGIGQWDGSTPLVCDGNDDIQISGVTAKFPQGAAIVVRGNCHVKLTNCTIQAPTAIDASSNGSVTVTNGSVTGEIHASSNANVDLVGNVKSSGAVKKSGNARVNGR